MLGSEPRGVFLQTKFDAEQQVEIQRRCRQAQWKGCLFHAGSRLHALRHAAMAGEGSAGVAAGQWRGAGGLDIPGAWSSAWKSGMPTKLAERNFWKTS